METGNVSTSPCLTVFGTYCTATWLSKRSSLSGILVERANLFALREGHLPKQFRHWRPEIQELAMAFSICGLMSMILQWHRSNFSISPDDMTQLALNMLTTPLLPQ